MTEMKNMPMQRCRGFVMARDRNAGIGGTKELMGAAASDQGCKRAERVANLGLEEGSAFVGGLVQ